MIARSPSVHYLNDLFGEGRRRLHSRRRERPSPRREENENGRKHNGAGMALAHGNASCPGMVI